jgi:hypothetical protein
VAQCQPHVVGCQWIGDVNYHLALKRTYRLECWNRVRVSSGQDDGVDPFGGTGYWNSHGVGVHRGQGLCFVQIACGDCHAVACETELLDQSGAHVAGANDEDVHDVSFT